MPLHKKKHQKSGAGNNNPLMIGEFNCPPFRHTCSKQICWSWEAMGNQWKAFHPCVPREWCQAVIAPRSMVLRYDARKPGHHVSNRSRLTPVGLRWGPRTNNWAPGLMGFYKVFLRGYASLCNHYNNDFYIVIGFSITVFSSFGCCNCFLCSCCCRCCIGLVVTS